jgi:hypothetical protein
VRGVCEEGEREREEVGGGRRRDSFDVDLSLEDLPVLPSLSLAVLSRSLVDQYCCPTSRLLAPFNQQGGRCDIFAFFFSRSMIRRCISQEGESQRCAVAGGRCSERKGENDVERCNVERQ